MSYGIITRHEVVVYNNKRVGWSFCIRDHKLVHDSHFVPVYGPLAILVADIKLLIKFSLNNFFLFYLRSASSASTSPRKCSLTSRSWVPNYQVPAGALDWGASIIPNLAINRGFVVICA